MEPKGGGGCLHSMIIIRFFTFKAWVHLIELVNNYKQNGRFFTFYHLVPLFIREKNKYILSWETEYLTVCLLRTRRALSLYNVYGVNTLLPLSGALHITACNTLLVLSQWYLHVQVFLWLLSLQFQHIRALAFKGSESHLQSQMWDWIKIMVCTL